MATNRKARKSGGARRSTATKKQKTLTSKEKQAIHADVMANKAAMAEKLCEVDSAGEDNIGAYKPVVAVRKRGQVHPTDIDIKLNTSASDEEQGEISPTKGKWRDIIGSDVDSDNDIEDDNDGGYNGILPPSVVKNKQRQERTSLTCLTNPQESPMIQTPAKTGAASSSHPADAVGALALVSIQKERQNKRTIERYCLPTKDSNGEFKDSLMAQELRKLVKSKTFHTVKFIPVDSNFLERIA
jgi:hypothetical protein